MLNHVHIIYNIFNINIETSCLVLHYPLSNKSSSKAPNNQTIVDQLFTLNLLRSFEPDYSKLSMTRFEWDLPQINNNKFWMEIPQTSYMGFQLDYPKPPKTYTPSFKDSLQLELAYLQIKKGGQNFFHMVLFGLINIWCLVLEWSKPTPKSLSHHPNHYYSLQ